MPTQQKLSIFFFRVLLLISVLVMLIIGSIKFIPSTKVEIDGVKFIPVSIQYTLKTIGLKQHVNIFFAVVLILLSFALFLSLLFTLLRIQTKPIKSTKHNEIRNRIEKILEAFYINLYEKEEEAKFTLLTSIAGEGIFLLGPPGVAKSLVGRKIKHCFHQEKSFEYLMTRFSTPDEVFGPISIKALKDKGHYIRLVKNYLPGANIVFLDEIWKAGPPIQNALLTVLNEKIYRNGDEEIHLHLYSLISASNELPAKGEGLEALWDRFLVRLLVKGVQKRDLFDQMLINKSNPYNDDIPKHLKITDGEYRIWSNNINDINITDPILEMINTARKKIEIRNEKLKDTEELIYISDRRWKKIIRLLKTCAFLNGREIVSLSDFFIIDTCIWNRENQIEDVRDIVITTVEESGYQIKENIKLLEEELGVLEQNIQSEKKVTSDIKISLKKSWNQKVLEIEKNRSELLVKSKNELLMLEKNLFVPRETKGIVAYDLKKFIEFIEYQLDENLKKIKSFYDEQTN